MSVIAWVGLIVRCRGGTIAALAAIHATLAMWVAWYVAEASWGSMPVGVSPTPLSPVAFRACWIAGAVFLVAVGPGIGAGAYRGPWVNSDPPPALPLGLLCRAAAAWMASETILLGAALAPLPMYLVLAEMGSVEASRITYPVVAQAAAIAVAPVLGIGYAMLRCGPCRTGAPGHA